MFYKKLAKLLLASGLMLTVAVGANTIEAKADKVIATPDYSELTLQLETTKKDTENAEYFYVGLQANGKVKVWDRIKAVDGKEELVPYQGEGIEKKESGWVYTEDGTFNDINNTSVTVKAGETLKTAAIENIEGVTIAGDFYYALNGDVVNADGNVVGKYTGTELEISKVVSKVAAIDISNYISPSKEYNIEVYSDADNTAASRVVVKLAKQSKKIKATYTPAATTGTKVKIDADGTELKGNAFQFKPLYAEYWMDGSELESTDSGFYSQYGMTMLEHYSLYGTTLLVREAPAYNATTGASEGMVSKEVKLKIPKSANGPKLAIDVNKLTIALPAGSSWRLVDREGNPLTTGTGGWTVESSKKSLTIKDMTDKLSDKTINILDNTVSIEAKINAKAKKADSKVSFLVLPSQLAGPTVGIGDNDKVKVEYVEGTGKKEGTITQVKITNNTGKDIHIVTGKKGSEVDSSTKYTTVKAGKPKVYTTTQLANNTQITVRMAGIKATKDKPDVVLASEFTDYKVVYPAKPDKMSGVKVEKGLLPGELYVSLTKVEGCTYTYEIVNEEVKELGLEEKSKGTPFTESELHSNLVAAGAAKDKYLVVYENAGGKVTRFYCEKITDVVADADKPAELTALDSILLDGTATIDPDNANNNEVGLKSLPSTTASEYKYKITSKIEKIYEGQDLSKSGFKTISSATNRKTTIIDADIEVGKYVLIIYTDSTQSPATANYQYIKIQ